MLVKAAEELKMLNGSRTSPGGDPEIIDPQPSIAAKRTWEKLTLLNLPHGPMIKLCTPGHKHVTAPPFSGD